MRGSNDLDLDQAVDALKTLGYRHTSILLAYGLTGENAMKHGAIEPLSVSESVPPNVAPDFSGQQPGAPELGAALSELGGSISEESYNADSADPGRNRFANQEIDVFDVTRSTQEWVVRAQPITCSGIEERRPVVNGLNSKDPAFMESSSLVRAAPQALRQAGYNSNHLE